MEYRQIVAVSGLPGLYQLMSSKNDGAMVKSLKDKSIKFISSRLHQLTPLESIEIYTYGDNVHLHEVLEAMKKDEDPIQVLIDNKKATNKELRSYFASILPEFDQERVYVSDIKKVLKWYVLLKTNDLLDFEHYNKQTEDIGEVVLDKKETESTADTKETEEAEEAVKKPAKKATTKKDEKVKDEESAEEKPAKKVASKKAAKSADGEEKKPAKKTAKKKED
ncbi:MAG TPA: DUF5606 domain-containing protein [Edaphocola sp.]|nr:DUF5606 domain-containing protein [Edaphocola sp.]